MALNLQEKTWANDFGKDYTNRNTWTTEYMDQFYTIQYGVSRTSMNAEFIDQLRIKNGRVLEVGCNVGNQLNLIQQSGFENIYGVELQWYAIEKAKELTKNINIVQATAEELPFRDNWFDMVFTSGVLIHISPQNIHDVMSEIYRCSKKYIWGFEYYSDEYRQIDYRGNENLLWKGNYAKMYLDKFPNLKQVKEKKYKYCENDNVDSMFLLEKC